VTSGTANASGQSNTSSPGGAGNSTDQSLINQALRPQPGTNGAGTAQSSGTASNAGAGVTTGSAGTDAAVAAENKSVDRKIKSICRGC
jgi:hypothetical protein